MIWQAPNLAREPFLNLRPLHRVAAVLILAALGLTGWNVASYLRAGRGEESRVAEINRLDGETTAARQRLDTIEHDLAAIDLAAENRRVEFLNQRIEERSFSWNLLFDHLAANLPDGVRLRSLAPRLAPAAGRQGAHAASERTPILLGIRAEADDDESMLAFVDHLYADPAFASPDLKKERRDARGGPLAFDLSVVYLPEGAP